MNIKKRFILLVDDEQSIVNALRRELLGWAAERSLEIMTTISARAGLEILESRGEDTIIVISDLQMPEIKGSEFLQRVKNLYPDIVSIILTGYSDIQEIVKAVRAGIFNFILKPWDSEYLVAELQKAYDFGETRRYNASYLKTVEDELKLAGVLQRAILKPNLPISAGAEFRVSYRPVSNLYCGGDYYDVIPLGPERYILLIGDVEGHGVKAAFVTGILKAIIYSEYVRVLGGKAFSPGAFLSWLNERLHFEFRTASSLIVTFFAAVLDLTTHSLLYSNAGQNHPIVGRSGKVIELPVSGSAIGLSSSISYTEQIFELMRDDVLVLFTDGLIEIACAEGRDPLKIGPIIERIAYGEEYHSRILEAALFESGASSFTDDVTIVTARIL